MDKAREQGGQFDSSAKIDAFIAEELKQVTPSDTEYSFPTNEPAKNDRK